MTHVLPLTTPQATLNTAGGKGVHLAQLALAGYPVPAGFIITTDAYRQFVAENNLQPALQAALAAADGAQPLTLETVSARIRALFTSYPVSPEMAAAIRSAYQALPQPASAREAAPVAVPVAVRSSATAEDLPELSFAGQQDTYLNVVGEAALLRAVVDCWSSLWTARAIGYRARNDISADTLALAVVVQQMVASEASGVMFTANPLTGKRTETVIDATLGLGEALVSGQVEPDHYVAETATRQILSKKLGAKALSIRGQAGGGTLARTEEASQRQALPDDDIRALTTLGQRVHAHYGLPQDIEWAWAGGQLYLLQARPITALYPVPEGVSANPLHLMFSFGAVQGVLEPFTPLGRDLLRSVMACLAGLFGYTTTYETQGVLRVAGERLWADATALMRNGLGRSLARAALNYLEPSVGQALDTLWDDPRLAPTAQHPSPAVVARVAPRVLMPLAARVLRFLLDPEGSRKAAGRALERYLAETAAQSTATGDWRARLGQRLALLQRGPSAFPFAIRSVLPGLAAGMVSLSVLIQMARRLLPPTATGGPPRLVLELTRSLPRNVTTEMDLALWETAQALRADAASAERFAATTATQLAADYLSRRLPSVAQTALDHFLEHYGMRGPGEIDLGRQRWREDPTPLLQNLQSYLQITAADQAPSAVFKRGEQSAAEALAELQRLAHNSPSGWLKAHLVRFATDRMRALLSLRESPKFFWIQVLGVIRAGLLETGADLVTAGVLQHPDDIFFLNLSELENLAHSQTPPESRSAEVGERRANYAREKLRRQIPRVLLSDGQAIYAGMNAVDNEVGVIMGSPVSPGVVEGVVRIILDPRGAPLAPGEILVCPGTDPAWTPLFLSAGGLIMEVGGMMTHGSVVAREYGLPAVVGVDQATHRLQTGQRVRLDGNTGRIKLLG